MNPKTWQIALIIIGALVPSMLTGYIAYVQATVGFTKDIEILKEKDIETKAYCDMQLAHQAQLQAKDYEAIHKALEDIIETQEKIRTPVMFTEMVVGDTTYIHYPLDVWDTLCFNSRNGDSNTKRGTVIYVPDKEPLPGVNYADTLKMYNDSARSNLMLILKTIKSLKDTLR